jgi:hypothetical protein
MLKIEVAIRQILERLTRDGLEKKPSMRKLIFEGLEEQFQFSKRPHMRMKAVENKVDYAIKLHLKQ